jgi:diguanylate cyclase (GGDEF)-like protein
MDCGSICVVDDDPANLTLLGSILSNHGFTILPAVDGDIAFKIIKAEHPDLILLDIMISPEIDGYEICKKLKADENTQDIPVIFMSALNQTIDKVKAFQVGGVDYITKPFQTEEVLARVQTQVQQHNIQKQLKYQYEALEREISKRRHVEKILEQTNKRLELLVTLDPLSGLNNRRHFNKHFEQEWKRMIREKESVAILLCDIDRFEEHNRAYGTLAGDLILQKMANIIKRSAKRPGDLIARWGEDEFILLLPRTDQQGAETLARSIQKNQIDLKSHDSKSKDGDFVTISIGIATTIPTYGIQKETLLSDAAEALAKAKETGRNTVFFSQPAP